MLHKVKSTYREIAKYFPELNKRLSAPDHKKQTLLKMAGKEGPRPSQKTEIGRALSQYTSPKSTTYDPDFCRKMKNLRPEWFLSQTQVANQKKKELIKMAKIGQGRPSHDRTKLGQALSNYTRKKSPAYDPSFDKVIRKLRPDWF